MKTEIANSKKLQNKFLSFRKKIYGEKKLYVDNSFFMLKEIFSDKLHFTKSLSITPLMVEDDENNILCEGIIAVARDLPEYVQLCFFEALEGVSDAVNLLVDEAVRIGKSKGCKRLVIGLYGHVNYGLGFLDSHFDKVNSFSSPGNPSFYNDYFRSLNCEEVKLIHILRILSTVDLCVTKRYLRSLTANMNLRNLTKNISKNIRRCIRI